MESSSTAAKFVSQTAIPVGLIGQLQDMLSQSSMSEGSWHQKIQASCAKYVVVRFLTHH